MKLHRNFVFLSVILVSACGGGGSIDNTGTTPPPPPPITPSPTSSRFLSQNDTIVIVFATSVDISSLILGGNLVSESNGGAWSQTNAIDDTLTISPATMWVVGTDRTLTVDVRDLSGIALPTRNMTFDVFNGTRYYVSSSASNDAGDGLSPATAKQTIMAAINLATAPATVIVNAGHYDVSSLNGDSRIVLKEGISLFGGYNSDFSDHDPANFASTIRDQSELVTSFPETNFAIRGNTAITNATIIDGFTVIGSSQTSANISSAIYLSGGASPRVQNNTIDGGNGNFLSIGMLITQTSSALVQNNAITGGNGGNSSYAIFNRESSSPTIQYNTINGGDGLYNSGAIVNVQSSSPLVQNNDINGGNGGTGPVGIYNEQSSPVVLNNTIRGGNGNNTVGIYNTMSSSATIRNNFIYGGTAGNTSMAIDNGSSSSVIEKNTIHGGSGGDYSYGIHISSSSLAIRNNTIYGGNSNLSSNGIRNSGAPSPNVQNNTIHGGNALYAYGFYNYNSAPVLVNNILLSRSGANSFCFNEDRFSSLTNNPAALRNNTFAGCDTLYFDSDAGCAGVSNCTSVDQINALMDIPGGVTNNTAIDPQLADIDGVDNDISTMEDNNWHLSASTPASITTGGLNGVDEGWSFTDDKDGVTRPASGSPWAIGAYEPDP